jgi:hypothetical protein
MFSYGWDTAKLYDLRGVFLRKEISTLPVYEIVIHFIAVISLCSWLRPDIGTRQMGNEQQSSLCR